MIILHLAIQWYSCTHITIFGIIMLTWSMIQTIGNVWTNCFLCAGLFMVQSSGMTFNYMVQILLYANDIHIVRKSKADQNKSFLKHLLPWGCCQDLIWNTWKLNKWLLVELKVLKKILSKLVLIHSNELISLYTCGYSLIQLIGNTSRAIKTRL